MRKAFIQLHVSILLAGFTGVLGKLISLNEGLLVWYRMLISLVVMLLLSFLGIPRGGLRGKLPGRGARPGMMGVGVLLALHWVFFFGSIKASNVSIGVVCFSLTSLFTALLEPLAYRRRIVGKDVLASLIPLAGILMIFHFEVRFRTGILLGIVSSLLAALFTIANKEVAKERPATLLLFYEMLGGCLSLSLLMPFYLARFPAAHIVPGLTDFLWLLVFAICCTVWLYLLQIEALKHISAFTLNLSYNLEPVYSILLAMLFLGEAKELSLSFYAGLGLIILSVLLQTGNVLKRKRPTP
ncbi:MAG: DMT family transporter [Tannerellaceae bacterium]|jgi:drug/metabolite transporter (DMT)-like permease|nr:DMT family transporter [Tannerellaceae bacterium]